MMMRSKGNNTIMDSLGRRWVQVENQGNTVSGFNMDALKIITAGELLDMELPERKPLVKPWLREGESTMIFAAPGVGKSLFALELALGVAGKGSKVAGLWETVQPWRVLYVDGEMPLDDVQSRMRKMLDGGAVSAEAKEVVRRHLSVLARSQQNHEVEFIDLANGESREGLLKKAVAESFDLIILDNLSTLASIEDENAAGMFNDTVKFLQQLKQAGIACVLVHHSNKTGSSYRGSSKIATTFETILQLEAVKRPEEVERGVTRFSVKWVKYRGKRDGGILDGTEFRVANQFDADATDAGGKAVIRWACVSEEDARIERMLCLLRSRAYSTQAELAKVLEVTKGTVSKWKKKAIEEELVTQEEWKACLEEAEGGEEVPPAF